MKCKKVKILLAPYILGDLADDFELSTQLEAHLKNCNNCTEEYQEIGQTLQFVQEYKDLFADAFAKIDQKRAREEDTQKRAWKKVFPGNRNLFVKISAVAACLVVGLGLFMASNQFNKAKDKTSPVASNQQQSPVKIELISGSGTEIIPAGQRITAVNGLKTLRINGNRQMVLNMGTELSIEPYNLGCMVKLNKGEIYTEVEHDGKPFVVKTPHGRAVITGTTFNIKADSSTMDLAVIDGSVQFESVKGTVTVQGGYQSSIISGATPTRPVACNIGRISQWAMGQKKNGTIQDNQPDSRFSELLDRPVSFLPHRDLEDIDFDIWISQHRPWFEREFPWTKRLQNILSIEGIQADTIDLLIESGDLRRFAWPQDCPTQILSEDSQIIRPIATHYGIKIDRLISAKSFVQSNQISSIEAFEKWRGAFDKDRGNVTLNSIHAAVFLVNTRSLVWFAVQNDKIQVQDKQQILDLLAEQVRIVSGSLETLNQLLLADKNESVCSVAQYDEYIKKIKDDISVMVAIEKELAGHEIISE